MQEFEWDLPTKVIFGRGAQACVGREIKERGAGKALIVYGQGSVEKSGLLGSVRGYLEEAGVSYAEWGGAQPNPLLSHAQAGAEYAIAQKADFILAVGGGSAIDTAKAIAHGAANPSVPLWDFWEKKAQVAKSLPVGVVLTIPAAGSEMSDSAVLTNEKTHKKMGLTTPFNRPAFAAMNPELAATLPKYQVACGVSDIMMHTLERYFIPGQKNRMTDEIAEGLLRTVIENGRLAVGDAGNYDAMSELMWCGSLSHNGITGLGRKKDFSVHKLGHALSARYGCAHGASLTSVWGSWAEYVFSGDIGRFAHYGRKVWGLDGDGERTAMEAIGRTVAYFKEIGMPTSLGELGVGEPDDGTLRELALDATMGGAVELSVIRKLNTEDVFRIFKAAGTAQG